MFHIVGIVLMGVLANAFVLNVIRNESESFLKTDSLYPLNTSYIATDVRELQSGDKRNFFTKWGILEYMRHVSELFALSFEASRERFNNFVVSLHSAFFIFFHQSFFVVRNF